MLAALLLLVAAGYWLERPVWNVRGSVSVLIGLFAAAYLLCALALFVCAPRGRSRLLQVALAGFAAFGAVFMVVLLAEWKWPESFGEELPRGYAFFAAGLGVALLVLVAWAQGWLDRRRAWVLPAVLLVAVAIAQFSPWSVAAPARSAEITHFDTSLHVVKATRYKRRFSERARGGAIAAMGDGFLVAGGAGGMYLVAEGDEPEVLDVRPLAYRIPINAEEFSSAGREAFGDAWTDHYHRERLRVADLVVQERPDGSFRIFASHHYWKPEEQCFAVRVSMLEGGLAELSDEQAVLAWRTLYEFQPCIEFNRDGHRGAWFAGYQIGGAMALLDEENLLVAVGDHEYDGWNRSPLLPQDPASPYGKLMLLDVASGKAAVYSLGHRNPQGLYVGSDGTVWSTEHGPRGGDELNQVKRGANYGWPLVTYGTEYWLRHWPVNEAAGRHTGFEKPAFAFVPSIALSSLTGVSGPLFSGWAQDLLLVSLSGELVRMRIEDGHAVVAESMSVDGRVRDVAQSRDGRIALWTDEHDLIFLEPADEHSPQALIMMCAGCHTFNRRETASIGPNLWQIVGRRVAADEAFEYSRPMQEHGGRWSRERLDEFLANPAAAVPGNSMQFDGIDDPGDRELLIDFLEELR